MSEKKIIDGMQYGFVPNRHLWYFEYYTPGNCGIFMKMNKHLYSAQSKYQRIDIFETDFFGRVFSLDGITMTTEKDDFFYHEMLVHVPMFMHPNPKKVLVIGGGDGGSVREVLKHKSVEKVIMCEIDEMVVEAAKKYLPVTASKLDDPRVELVFEDGSQFVRNFKNEFDVIIIDSTDPTAGEGGHLFTEDFYKACFDALKENGTFSAESEDWLYDGAWLRLAYSRIKKVFPVTKLYLGFMPTYPSGMWGYTFASKGVDPIKDFDPEKVKNFGEELKYYNEEIHKAAFALPTFLKKELENL
ncbi:spermidine synthase [Thermosipho africanus Ob7]|jgi:spermidine synthase|uniref:Polyamine aminopropyltransferase n=1 Tax=Thermosipho africanus (strain TCF52B) TaxID=484019 RepID=B7ICX0_THEAB|nr:polyamine aminopropyltransferase [Thermosipho africanus]ACJ75847.1 spermidine synthase [Thermosipho africanus TCF52B]RDI91844.1 spermidine synthase [Thermosipho africanus Ob7]